MAAANETGPSAEGFSRLILDGIVDAILIADLSGAIVSCNIAAERIFGYRLDEIEGRRAGLLIADWEQAPMRPARLEVIGRRKNGTSFSADLALNEATREGKSFVVGVIRDITEYKETMDSFRHTATHDFLTALPNRFLMYDRLQQAMVQAQRSGTRLAVLFLDVDHFKEVNDTYGHQTGDLLLKAVAKRIAGCVRESDTVARLGGDEFAVIETNLSREEGVGRLAEKIIDALSEPFMIEGRKIDASSSIGVSIYPDGYGEADADQLIRRADMAMYDAKARGRRRYSIHDQGMDDSAAYRLTLPADVERALSADEFVLLYQPQVDLDIGEIVAVEAFIRWNHPARGLLEPADFLDIAESSPVIAGITDWVMTSACYQLGNWIRLGAGGSVKRVTVNVSSSELKQEGLADRLLRIANRCGISPRRVEIEFSERTLAGDVGTYEPAIRRLHSKGFRIAIDNFGSGFSSLAALASLPVSAIKIDGSLVSSIGNESEGSPVDAVKAVIGIGKSLGKVVIAEDIESPQQLEYLKAHGCAYGQGFLFGHPVTEDEIVAILKRGTGLSGEKSPSYTL